MANNPLTDEKRIVETISVQSFWGIFNRIYTAENGFSLELFRGRTYLGAINSNEITRNTKGSFQRFKLRNNDTILRVNLGYRTLDIKCQLAMRDGWVRPFEGVVKIVVNNPYLFALQYLQETDPVMLTKLAIEDAMKRYVRRCDHDNINDSTLRYEIRMSLLQGTYKNYGLEVVEVLVSNIYLDPKQAEMLAIKQQGMVNEVKIHADSDNAYTQEQRSGELQGLKGVNERSEQGKDAAFQQEQDELKKEHERRQALADDVFKRLKQNMLNDLEDGVPPETLIRRYPQFAPLLGFPIGNDTLPAGKQQPLINNSPTNSPSDENTITGSHIILPPLSNTTSQPFYNARIGAWLVYMLLSDKQRQRWGVNNRIAFTVSSYDTGSIAEQAYMEPNDIIIEVDDQPVQSAKQLINALDTMRLGVPLVLRVLRDGQPIDLELNIL